MTPINFSKTSWFVKVGLAFGVFIFAGETLLRLFYFGPDALAHLRRYEPLVTVSPWHLVPSENPRIAVENRSDYSWYYLGHKVSTNAHALVDERLSLPERTGQRVIVMLGESYMEGAGVDPSMRVSSLLEKKIRQSGKEYAVLNAALTNTVLESQIERLKRKILPFYKPDLVLVSFIPDRLPSTVLPPEVWVRRAEEGPQPYPLWKISFFLFVLNDYGTRVRELVEASFHRFKSVNSMRVENQSVLKKDGAAGIEHSNRQRVDALLDELQDLARQYGFKTVLVPITPMKDFANASRMQEWRDLAAASAQSRGISVIDTFPFFTGQNVRTCVLWLMNRHPNAYANEVFAQNLFLELEQKKLI